MKLEKRLLLGTGLLLLFLSGMRWNVAVAGWLAPVPFLMYGRKDFGKKSLGLTLVLGIFLQTLKIASEPMYAMIAVLSGLQGGLVMWLVYYLVGKSRKFLSEVQVVLLFASLVTMTEYLGSFSVLGVWGMAVNTQLDNLAFLQLASVTGAYGISFLLMIAAAGLELVFSRLVKKEAFTNFERTFVQIILGVFLAASAFAAIRLDRQVAGNQVRVAGISAREFDIMDVLLNEKKRKANNSEVLSLAKKSIERGAELVVSNEGAIVLKPEEEQDMKNTLSQISRDHQVSLVTGYLILAGEGKFKNRMLVTDNKGRILQDYSKQFVPPGEPAIKEDSAILPLQQTSAAGNYVMGGAICYDFDSMAITKTHGENGAGLVAVPSSDWRGIDPVHPQMTRLRAIEQGFSVIRSSRASVSVMYDAYGRVRGALPWYEENDGILLATLPTEPVFTIYRKFGDWFVLLNALVLCWFVYSIYRKKTSVV